MKEVHKQLKSAVVECKEAQQSTIEKMVDTKDSKPAWRG